jgi:hypothetical protein
MLFDFCVIVVGWVATVSAQVYYDIPAYYGHFSLRYFDPAFISAGKLVQLEYHFAADANYRNDTIFYADPNLHCIYQYDVASQSISVLVGQCGVSGNMVGSKENAIFNGVSSVAYFR